MSGDADYGLGASDGELTRLLELTRVYRELSSWLLDRVSVPLGGSAVDFGCGVTGVLDLLSERVGKQGRVVGLDNEPRMLARAKELLSARAPAVELHAASAADSRLPSEAFDVAHARLLLVNVPNPAAIVHEMARVVRRGGRVAVQDVDWVSWSCEPDCSAWRELLALLVDAWVATGCDPFIGRRLIGMLTSADLADVQQRISVKVWREGDLHYRLLVTFSQIYRDRILTSGRVDAARLEELLTDVNRHLDRPGTVVIHPLIFQVWGVKA